MKRSWTNIKELELQIMVLKAEGKARRKIAKELGLNEIQIKNWINRHNREEKRKNIGLPSKGRGRKPAATLQEYKYENKRLQMENELLRNFIHASGRK